MIDSPVDVDALAAAFVAARQAGRAMPVHPGPTPATMEEAYAVQDRAIALSGRQVKGWKVGRIQPPHDGRFGRDKLAGPIFADAIAQAGANPAMPVIVGGFAAVEAEFLIRLARAPDGVRTSWSPNDVAALVGAVHVGLEIAGSPFAGINDHGPAVTVSDFGNNAGLVVGPPVDDWAALGFERWPISLTVDGTEVGRATAVAGATLDAVRFLLEELARRGVPLAAGDWVSTGAVTGVHQVAPGATVEARFGDLPPVRCTIAAAGASAD